MCNCSKKITKSECQQMLEYANDPLKRFFIYHVFDGQRGLEIAYVDTKIEDPNIVALRRGFVNSEGIPEWFNVKEHPCVYEKEKK